MRCLVIRTEACMFLKLTDYIDEEGGMPHGKD